MHRSDAYRIIRRNLRWQVVSFANDATRTLALEIEIMEGVEDFFARARWISAALGLAIFILAIVGLLKPTPPISSSLANVLYISICCGSVMLQDGHMMFNRKSASYRLYVIKTDLDADVDGDPVITVDHQVEVLPKAQRNRLSFWRYPYRTNITNAYDARRERPNRISMWGADYSGPYDFVLTPR